MTGQCAFASSRIKGSVDTPGMIDRRGTSLETMDASFTFASVIL